MTSEATQADDRETPSASTSPSAANGGGILFTVPLDYQVNARAETSVESVSLLLLAKGSVHTAVARTIDTAWLQFALPDGRLAWVFTDSLQAERSLFASLPEVYTLLPSPDAPPAAAAPAEAPPPTSASTAPAAGADPPSSGEAAVTPPPPDTPVPATENAGDGARVHLVQNGDFLKQLAVVYYGDDTLWTLIYEANRELIGDNPNILSAGQSLVIPPTD